MKFAITGASGQFGRRAVGRLLERIAPSDLILLSRSPDTLAEYQAMGCLIRRGDFDDPVGLVSAFSGANRLLLISGTRVGKRIPQHSAAIDAAQRAGVSHVVYTSFLGADNPANRSQAVSDHRGTEAALKASRVKWTALRNAQYADAVTDVMAHTMVQDGVMRSVAGDGRMPFVCRDDCVDAAVSVLTGSGHEDRGYNITGPELISYRQVGALIAEFTRQPVRVELTDEAGLYAMFDALGVPREPVANGNADVPWNSDDMVSFEAAVRDGQFAVESKDFEALTGRAPRSLRSLFEERWSKKVTEHR